MKVIIDLNVLLDVIQKRLPHYDASAKALSRVLNGEVDGVLPGHAVTTIYYVVAKYADRAHANDAVDWMIKHFDIEASGKADFVQARSLSLTDFEDAVVAALAKRTGCDYIVTRNISDFAGSPVPAITPLAFLSV